MKDSWRYFPWVIRQDIDISLLWLLLLDAKNQSSAHDVALQLSPCGLYTSSYQSRIMLLTNPQSSSMSQLLLLPLAQSHWCFSDLQCGLLDCSLRCLHRISISLRRYVITFWALRWCQFKLFKALVLVFDTGLAMAKKQNHIITPYPILSFPWILNFSHMSLRAIYIAAVCCRSLFVNSSEPRSFKGVWQDVVKELQKQNHS